MNSTFKFLLSFAAIFVGVLLVVYIVDYYDSQPKQGETVEPSEPSSYDTASSDPDAIEQQPIGLATAEAEVALPLLTENKSQTGPQSQEELAKEKLYFWKNYLPLQSKAALDPHSEENKRTVQIMTAKQDARIARLRAEEANQ